MLKFKMFCFVTIFSQIEAQLFNFFSPSRGGYTTSSYNDEDYNHDHNSNFLPQQSHQSLPLCSNIWSYSHDENGNFGLVEVSTPNRVQNDLRIKLTIGVRLTGVSFRIYLNIFKVNKFTNCSLRITMEAFH